MSLILRICQRLLSDLGLIRPKLRAFELDEELAPFLQDLALREQRTEGEVVSDLLTSAIIQRQKAEENLKRWRDLSRREREVVALVCLGYTNQEIADRLVISPETVKAHIRHAVGKFGLRTKAQLQQVLEDWDFSAWDVPIHTG
jgi:DNA-binding CsgD family transcriptional regulator